MSQDKNPHHPPLNVKNSVLNFAQFRANRGSARKCVKISTNKVDLYPYHRLSILLFDLLECKKIGLLNANFFEI